MQNINLLRKFQQQLDMAASYDMGFDRLLDVIGQTYTAETSNVPPQTVLIHLWTFHEDGSVDHDGPSACGMIYGETKGDNGNAKWKCPACSEWLYENQPGLRAMGQREMDEMTGWVETDTDPLAAPIDQSFIDSYLDDAMHRDEDA